MPDPGEWAFDVGDVVVAEDAPDVAPEHHRVKRRLTDEDGERYYHLAIRLKTSNGWSESYGDWLAPAEEIDGGHRHATE